MRRSRALSGANVVAAALLAASLALFAGGVGAFGQLRDACERTGSFTLAGAGLSQEEAEAACQAALELGNAGPGALAFWSQTFDFVQVEGRPAAADVAVVGFAGDARLLAPELPAWPIEPGSCVLSAEAWRLLLGADGAADAVGATVLVGGEALAVAGVVEDGRAFVLKPGAAGPYARVTARAYDADGFPVTGELVGSVAGARVEALDYRALSLVAFAGLFLYPLALVGVIGALCVHVRAGRVVVQAVCGATLAGGAIGATAAFAGALPAFGGYFPTRWSDFPAWGEAARAWADGAARAVYSQQGVLEEPLLAGTAACLTLAAGALATLATGLALMRPQGARDQGKHARKQVR